MLLYHNIYRLVCTALYNDGDGERKYLPQFFKFIVANPISVRTKVSFHNKEYLNMCIKIPVIAYLYLDDICLLCLVLTFKLVIIAGPSCQGRLAFISILR